MAKFKILFMGQARKTEEVEADDFVDDLGEWITFRKHGDQYPMGVAQVLRLRAKGVDRIDRVSDD